MYPYFLMVILMVTLMVILMVILIVILVVILIVILIIILMYIVPECRPKGHEATGDDHGQPEGAAQQPDHGDEGHNVEDGAVVGQERHQLVRPAVHDDGCVVNRAPGVPHCVC